MAAKGKAQADPFASYVASLSKGGDAGRNRKRVALESMSRSDLDAEVRKRKFMPTQSKDTGALRAEIFHAMGLGIPDRKGWTKMGALYVLTSVLGLQCSAAEIRDKRACVETLDKALRVDRQGDEAPPEAEVVSGGDESGDEDRAVPMETLGKRWRGSSSAAQLASSATMFASTMSATDLSMSPSGWERFVNFECCPEFLSASYPRSDLQGVHFVTATVRYLRENADVMKHDASGFGAATAACHEAAHEWLGIMFEEGVQRLGPGATVAQIRLSRVAQKGLAGSASKETDPVHLAMLFSQLVQAGQRIQIARPFTPGNVQTPKHVTSSIAPVFVLPEAVLDQVETAALALTPSGVDPVIVRKAITATASKPGMSFRDKQVSGWKLVGQGRLKEVDVGSEATFSVVHSAKQLQRALLSLSEQALMSASVSSGHAEFMRLSGKPMQQCLMALVSRDFTNDHFEMASFVEHVGGAPTKRELARSFGEANKCRMSATMCQSTESVDDDRKMYPWLQLTLLYIIVADVPTLDFGFRNALMWFVENTLLFSSTGTPMSLVCRCLCKIFAHAQRSRDQTLAYPEINDELVLQFTENATIMAAKKDILQWGAQDHSSAILMWNRYTSGASRSESSGGSPLVSSRRVSDTPHWSPNNKINEDHARNAATMGASILTGNSMRQIQSLARGGTGTPPAKSEFPYNKIDQALWKDLYGRKAVKGKEVMCCWFRANRPGGCTNQDNGKCKFDHDHLPTCYGNKVFALLDGTQQRTILTACKKS